jgi:hypothetical protein
MNQRPTCHRDRVTQNLYCGIISGRSPHWVKVKNPAAPEAEPNPGGSVDPLLAAEAVAFRLALQLEQACLP